MSNDSEVKVHWLDPDGADAGICLIVKRPWERNRRYVMLNRCEALMLARRIHETWGWPVVREMEALKLVPKKEREE